MSFLLTRLASLGGANWRQQSRLVCQERRGCQPRRSAPALPTNLAPSPLPTFRARGHLAGSHWPPATTGQPFQRHAAVAAQPRVPAMLAARDRVDGRLVPAKEAKQGHAATLAELLRFVSAPAAKRSPVCSFAHSRVALAQERMRDCRPGTGMMLSQLLRTSMALNSRVDLPRREPSVPNLAALAHQASCGSA